MVFDEGLRLEAEGPFQDREDLLSVRGGKVFFDLYLFAECVSRVSHEIEASGEAV